MTNTQKVLSELKHGGRVSRYTAIQKNLAENLTATISQLRKKGYHVIYLFCCIFDYNGWYTTGAILQVLSYKQELYSI